MKNNILAKQWTKINFNGKKFSDEDLSDVLIYWYEDKRLGESLILCLLN